MDDASILPFREDTDFLLRHCRLPPHVGVGRVDLHGDPESEHRHPLAAAFAKIRESIGQTETEAPPQEFSASFFVPASGGCRVLCRWTGECQLARNFGKGLVVTGDSSEGEFRLTCPQYYVKIHSENRERPGWAVASLVNEPAIVSYGDARPVASATAILNNFDFDHGNVYEDSRPRDPRILRVAAMGRVVDFRWRESHPQLRRLVDAGLIGTTSLATFSFPAWFGASDAELVSFAHDISSLCSYVAGQHTGVPVLSFFDAEGRVVRRIIRNTVESKFRDENLLPVMHTEEGLPRLFRESFDEHSRMMRSQLWRQLPSFYASIEDPPYLEQKYSSLMAAVELFIRSSLVETGHLSTTDAESKTLDHLIGMARGTLRWIIPKHYTRQMRHRTTRNAVAHGSPLTEDVRQVRADFDKWKLFLSRQILIRMRYRGNIRSPQDGWASSSPVHEFSEDHNSF